MSDCPTVVRLRNGTRVVVRHQGVPGPPGDTGDAGDVTGPVTSVVGRIATWGDTTGDSLLNGSKTIAELEAEIALKETSVPGSGLSEENYTLAEKTKLAGLFEHFRGEFEDEATLIGTITSLEAVAGDYAILIDPVANPANEAQLAVWDSVNEVWTLVALGSTPYTSAEIQAALATDSDYNLFSDFYRNKVDQSVDQGTFNAAIAVFSGGTAFATVANETTTARVLALADMGAYIRMSNVAGCDLTIENDATVIWPGFPEIRFRIDTAGPITFTLGAGVTLNNGAAIAGLVQHDNFAIKKVAVGTWDLVLNG
jgi:hypothetical protein